MSGNPPLRPAEQAAATQKRRAGRVPAGLRATSSPRAGWRAIWRATEESWIGDVLGGLSLVILLISLLLLPLVLQ